MRLASLAQAPTGGGPGHGTSLNRAPESPLFSSRMIRQSGYGVGGTYPRILGVDPMKLRLRKACWFVPGLLLVTMVSASLEFVVAQPKSETSRPAFDTSQATFELLGEHKNVRNIAYIESNEDSVVVNFNARISDAFVQLTLSGADAESFRKKRQEF